MANDADAIRRLRELGRQIDPLLDDRDVDRVLRGVAHRGERARQRRSLALGLLAGGVVTALLAISMHGWVWRQASTVASASATSAPSAPSPAALAASALQRHSVPSVVFADGSRASPLDSDAELILNEDSTRLAQLSLARGRARFEVAPQKERKFVVRAGAVSVTVIGTVFEVEVVADRVGVAVEHGAVAVDWGVDHARLSAGEKGWFPPLMVREPRPPNGLGNASRPGRGSSHASERAPSARDSADSRAPSTTLAEAESQDATNSSPSAQELFSRVDAARASGQTALAVALLRQILRERGGDARAPLAAMTLGRILLTELGRPREAAAAFAEVRTRGAGEPFAEDALAREVEAWARAGETQKAHSLAEAYLRRYAAGRYVDKVRALAGSQ